MSVAKGKINKFINYVDNTPTLKKLKVDVYLDINKTGWFGTSPFYQRFLYLFESMRKHYINENQMKGAGDVIQLSTQEMKDFCQYFVDEYHEIKNTLQKVLISEF